MWGVCIKIPAYGTGTSRPAHSSTIPVFCYMEWTELWIPSSVLFVENFKDFYAVSSTRNPKLCTFQKVDELMFWVFRSTFLMKLSILLLLKRGAEDHSGVLLMFL
jgi:hypothetical protein